MTTISITNTLDVASKYDTLVKQSLSGESAYIRAKETVEDLVTSGAIDESQKADVISKIIGSIIANITSSSMSTAIAWAQAEKEVELKKIELEKQLDILIQEALVKAAQTEQLNNAIRLAKVESKRMYGTAVFDAEGNITSLDNTGKVYNDILLTQENTTKTTSEVELVNQKVKESQAAIHKIVADTYVNFGNYTYSGLSDTGITTVTPKHGDFKTLSSTQQAIAVEQAKGYTYNAWANALTGSASAVGTAIAAGIITDVSNTTTPAGKLWQIFSTAAYNLQQADTVDTAATPVPIP